jgi:hypothetical protein
VEILVDQTAPVNAMLAVRNTCEQVIVTTETSLRQVESASLGQVEQGKAVTDMPLNRRNVL